MTSAAPRRPPQPTGIPQPQPLRWGAPPPGPDTSVGAPWAPILRGPFPGRKGPDGPAKVRTSGASAPFSQEPAPADGRPERPAAPPKGGVRISPGLAGERGKGRSGGAGERGSGSGGAMESGRRASAMRGGLHRAHKVLISPGAQQKQVKRSNRKHVQFYEHSCLAQVFGETAGGPSWEKEGVGVVNILDEF